MSGNQKVQSQKRRQKKVKKRNSGKYHGKSGKK